MDDCPNCEYHKNRAARWRAEAYAQAGHDIIERPWVGLTRDEILEARWHNKSSYKFARVLEAKLKDKNEQVKDT